MRRAVLALVVVALALAGCGSEQAQQRPAADTRITVVVHPQGPDGPQRAFTIDCPRDERCARIERTDFWTPPRRDVACTQIYGGKATGLITGRVRGRELLLEFDLHDGCAIERWRRFAWLLGPPPGGAAG